MKTVVLLTFLLMNASAAAQSVLSLGSGTSMGVLTGANLCANIINGSGILYGGGGICGGLVAIDPAALNELPTDFGMSQNYPNPFNPVTIINYQLPKAGYLTIMLYDQLGRELGILYEGNQQAGYYRAKVDGTNLASGIYFCRLTAAEYSKVVKMMLIK